jgi:nucleoid DNA-binding protein
VEEVIEVVEDGVVENLVEGDRVEVEEIVIFEVWIEVWIEACPMVVGM